MKEQGYKANRLTYMEDEKRVEKSTKKIQERMLSQQQRANENRIKKGLPPKEYPPFKPYSKIPIKYLKQEKFNLGDEEEDADGNR